MRLWTLHPKYLDAQGLVALWREALLAQAVLLCRTKGYTRHPQLFRFRETQSPMNSIAAYLRGIYAEAEKRGYRFDPGKIAGDGPSHRCAVTHGQLEYERNHLLAKLRNRDKQRFNLLKEIQQRDNLGMIFITHDFGIVAKMCDRVAVMYVGRLVEMAPTAALFATPRHPYTEALMSAVPKPDPRLRAQRIVLEGEVADPANPPPGCYFHPRCRYAADPCRTVTPQLAELQPGHFVSCHRAAELTLKGIVP